MSKAKDFMDTKTKARHRLRRFETHNKKVARIRNCKNNLYGWFTGYIYFNEMEYTTDDLAAVDVSYSYNGRHREWSELNHITHTKQVNIVKRVRSPKIKDYKRTTIKKIRYNRNFDEDCFDTFKGNSYKRLLDIDGMLW